MLQLPGTDTWHVDVWHRHRPVARWLTPWHRRRRHSTTLQEAERKAAELHKAQLREDERAAALHMRIESELKRRRTGKQRRLPTIQSPPRTVLQHPGTVPPMLSLDSSADGDDVWAYSKSRYRMDFEELGELGRGGFGQVLKVRNRMDGMLYAVKIIKLEADDDDLNRKIRREVLTVSRLYHRHIVRGGSAVRVCGSTRVGANLCRHNGPLRHRYYQGTAPPP